MKNEQGFSLIELLIVVAIIAVIAAIAVPNMLQARMAANETGAISSLRTYSSAQVAYSAIHNQKYAEISGLVSAGNLDSRWTNANGFNGYKFADGSEGAPGGMSYTVPSGFGAVASPYIENTTGRASYSIFPDQVVRYAASFDGYSVGEAVGLN